MTAKTKTLVVLVATFLLGVTLGGIFLPRIMKSVSGRSWERPDYRSMFHSRLELDDRQKAFVDSLLDAYKVQMDVHRVAMRNVRDSLRQDISTILTERQLELFRVLTDELNRRDNRWKSDSTRTR